MSWKLVKKGLLGAGGKARRTVFSGFSGGSTVSFFFVFDLIKI